jgi:tRNA-(ms[2]io[6]A)-hydroxylase
MELVDPTELEELMAFLPCPTPAAWIAEAVRQQETLLLNHCYLEQCAARTAMALLFQCPDKPDVLRKMSRLAREELHHFEQVLALLEKRGITYRILKPSRYAGRMNAGVRKLQPEHFVDLMVVGAFIEARSCERFAALAPHVDKELADFFRSLLKSEARHYKDYIGLAAKYSPEPIDGRIAFFGEVERSAIESPDPLFRFHSGIPETPPQK